ncbi:unnamed protein product [Blepharisma stoltei]|uniref:Uncharacterized protein n=1 Tax=Blepharisma stoltei TaxID=1481888 RepID=A0AAU9K709_9CILI|nr:unnamed protein product [Blepharisma stoltei]
MKERNYWDINRCCWRFEFGGCCAGFLKIWRRKKQVGIDKESDWWNWCSCWGIYQENYKEKKIKTPQAW